MKKRLLSVALILSMLASLLMVGITGPVSAAKDTILTTDYAYDSAIDLSKELGLVVDLPFEGEENEKYGISFGRWTNEKLSYADGYPKLTCGNHWFFFGKDGSMGKPGVDFYCFQGETDAATRFADAIDHLYTFEANNTYMVSFDVKALEGAVVNGTIKYGLNTNPAAGSNGDKTGMKDVSDKGFTLSATEEGSNWQKATTIFTVETAGKFGICPDIGGSIAIDNFKVYDLTALRAELNNSNSTVQNKLTFDFGGFGVNRYGSVSIGTEENGNNYGILAADCSSAYFASTEYTNVYKYEGGTGDTTKHINMFKFEAGKSYEVSFKYRYADGQGVTVGTSPILRLMQSPAGAAPENVNEDLVEGNSWAQDIVVKGLELKNDPSTGKWQEVKAAFTVKANCNGAYFGLAGDGKVLYVDDYEVKELVNYRLTTSLSVDCIYHDMENEKVVAGNDAASGTFVVHTGSGASVIASGDEHGDVLNFTTGTRGTFQDVEIFEKGKKYYISFDARATSGNTNKNIFLGFAKLWGGDINTGSYQQPRYFINNNGSLGGAFDAIKYAFQFYVNGENIEIKDFLLTNDWQRFGIVMDLTDEHVTTILEENADGTGLFSAPKCLYFGQQYSQYDNFKIIATDVIGDAVPTSDITYFSNEIYHDMEKTESFIENNTGKSHLVNSFDEKYGQVMEITSGGGRVAFNDSKMITSGKKYYISFDAKTTDNRETYMWLMMADEDSAQPPRFVISDTAHNPTPEDSNNPEICKGTTNLSIAENGSAFKYYIDGEKVIRDNFKLSGDWRKYALIIDTSDPELLENATSGNWQMAGLFNTAKYFFFGCENAWFDNFRMVEVREADTAVSANVAIYDTEVSCREESTSVDGEYISAGLRFKGKLPSVIAAEADEIGFVAAPSSLVKATSGWYKLEGEVNSVARKAIVKDGIRDYDYVYATEGDNTYYQLVFTGLSTEDNKTAYNRRFSAVMYTKVGNKYSYYPLGEASYYQVAGIESILNFDEVKLNVKTMASQNYKIVYDVECSKSWVVNNQIQKLKQAMNIAATVDTAAVSVSNYEIVIGNTTRGTIGNDSVTKNINRYAIRINGSKVYVMGGSTYALQAAIYELEKMVKNGEITEKEGSYLETSVNFNSASDYKLVWQSEFDDPNTVTYDDKKWASIKKWRVDPVTDNTDPNKTLIYNSQAYVASDKDTVAWDEQGYLILRAIKKQNSTITYNDTAWTGNTNLKYKHQGGISCNSMKYNYGYLEMRARIPDGNGVWSSFWLGGKFNGKTPAMEVDIFESGGLQGVLQTNVHWWNIDTLVQNKTYAPQNKDFFTKLNNCKGSDGSISYDNGNKCSSLGELSKFYPQPTTAQRRKTLSAGELYNQWHTIGLLWTEETMQFYFDGQLYCTQDINGFTYPDGTHAHANQLQNIVAGFNIGWNGRTTGLNESTMTWDNGKLNYIIDYFRLYQIDGQTLTVN